MTEITLDRQVIIYIYDVENSLFPSDDLFPDEDLYPGIGALIIEAGETDCGIVSGSMKYEEIIVDSNLVFGQCISNRFECEIFNISYDINGKTIYVVAKENGTQIPIFKGRVDDSTTDIYSYNRKIVAYDEFYYKRNMNVAEWWNDYWRNRESSTLKELRDNLCEYVGIEFTEKNLPNDSLVIKKDTEYTSLTFTDCLKMICELQGCFPNIDRMGFLDFITLESDSEELELIDKYERNTATFQSYTTAAITGIQVYSDASSLSQTVGSDDNPYSISGNIFLLNMTAEEIESCCQELLDAIKDISYKPSSIPMIVSELDMLLGAKVSTESGICYIFKNEYSGSLLIEEKITCAAVGENLEKKASSVNNEIIAGRKSSKIEQTLDGFVQLVHDNLKEASSEYKQTAETIVLKVDKNGRIVQVALETDAEKGTLFQVNADNINLNANDIINIIAGNTLNLSGKNIVIDFGNFTIDKDGNINAKGNASFKGSIESGSTISTPHFSIDEDGNVSIKGAIESGSTISTPHFSIDEAGNVSIEGSITSGSTIDTPNFSVDENGNVSIKGAIESGSTISTPNFSVDEQGHVKAVNGEFSGDGSFSSFHVQKDFSQGDKYNYTNLVKSEQDALAFGLLDESNILNGIIVYLNEDRGGETFVELNGTHIHANGSPIWTENNNDAVTSNDSIKSLIYQEDKYHNDVGSYLHVNTSVGAFGIDWWASDTKLKENISPTEITALDKLNQIEMIQFDWNGKLGRNKSHVDLGLSANQLETIIPEAVFEVKQPEDNEFNYIKQINENTLISYCIKSIQELSAEIENLKEEIKNLKGEK